MKTKLLATLITTLALLSSAAEARYQKGYIKKNGTYVEGHIKSNPDGKRYNNYGSQTNGGRQHDEFSNPPAYNSRRKH